MRLGFGAPAFGRPRNDVGVINQMEFLELTVLGNDAPQPCR